MRRGYRRVVPRRFRRRISPISTGAAPIGVDREALLAALRAYFARRGFEANWDAIEAHAGRRAGDHAGMVCPFEPAGEAGAAGGAERCRSARRRCCALLQMGAPLRRRRAARSRELSDAADRERLP